MWGHQFSPPWWGYPSFKKFEDVIDFNTIYNNIVDTFSGFQIPSLFSNSLANIIFMYGSGKDINLIDEKRWHSNFLSEINLFCLEWARYIQAYNRDINTNLESDGTSLTTTNVQGKGGNVSSTQSADVSNQKLGTVSGRSEQIGVEGLSKDFTTLNNQTTGTNYLATRNENTRSDGSVTESASSDFSDSNQNSINLQQGNAANLEVSNTDTTVSVNKRKSPLDISTIESSFKFKEFRAELLDMLDKYLNFGGYVYV